MRVGHLAIGCIVLGPASFVVAAQSDRPKVIYTPIVVSGDTAPGGGAFFKFLNQSVINDADQIIFQAIAAGGSSSGGLYMAHDGGITLIAP